MELLACCARGEMEPGYRERSRALLRSGLDWSRLMVLADRHKMLPLLWWHLGRESAAIPEASALALQRSFARNAARMLQLSGELLGLTRLLGDRGIPAVPYKGPVLGAYLYDNLALRQAGDLDLLVRRGDVARARALLLERGYRPRHALARGGKEFMVRSRYSEVLDRDDGSTVELHWAFTNGDIALPLDLDVLAPNLRTLPFGGGSVAIFGDEDLLLILCVHGSKHRWDRLEWLCGVAELLRRRAPGLDWDALVSRAATLGVRRMVLLGVLLAHDLLDAPVPREVLELARSDRPVAGLAAEVPQLFLTDAVDAEAGGNLATDSFRLRLRERPRDRLRFIWYRITTPSRPESWRALSIGGYALPLHGFLRPFGLAPKLISALRSYALRIRRFSRPPRP
jgi:hypothetical protein